MTEFWLWLENTELAFQIGATWWFPLLESIHVAGLTLMLGALLMVDLRLLGWAGRRYQPSALEAGMLGWAWFGFATALVSGLGMFISRPSHYAANPAFQIKLLLLVILGGNLLAYRNLRLWTERPAAALSLLLWIAVVLAGRWTGHIN